MYQASRIKITSTNFLSSKQSKVTIYHSEDSKPRIQPLHEVAEQNIQSNNRHHSHGHVHLERGIVTALHGTLTDTLDCPKEGSNLLLGNFERITAR